MFEDVKFKARSTTAFQLTPWPIKTLAGGGQPVRRTQWRSLPYHSAMLITTWMRCPLGDEGELIR